MSNDKKQTDAEKSATKLVLKNVRLSYAHLHEPARMANGEGKPKYSVSCIIPKSDTAQIDAIKACIKAATEQGKAKKFGGKVPVNLKQPLRDGDTDRPDNPEYANCFFVTASSATKPGIVDAKKQVITDETEVYSGIYGNVSTNFYAYNSNGSKGIACGLNHVQKVKDGESLGGRGNAADDFDELEEAGDSVENIAD